MRVTKDQLAQKDRILNEALQAVRDIRHTERCYMPDPPCPCLAKAQGILERAEDDLYRFELTNHSVVHCAPPNPWE